jgi:DNA topoisomerase I
VIAFNVLHEANRSKSVPTVKQIINQVSEALGNTPAVARKSYIHPAVLEAIGTPRPDFTCPRSTAWMSSMERGFLRFLEGSAPGSQFN